MPVLTMLCQECRHDAERHDSLGCHHAAVMANGEAFECVCQGLVV